MLRRFSAASCRIYAWHGGGVVNSDGRRERERRDEPAQLQIEEEEGSRPCTVSPPVDPNGRPHASSGVWVELRGAHRG